MENIDLEELEASLYGQVFHGTDCVIETGEEDGNSTVTIETDMQGRKYFNRYYLNGPNIVSSQEGPPEPISEARNSYDGRSENALTPIVNKITINQYTYSPLLINPEIVPSQEKKKTKRKTSKATKKAKREAREANAKANESKKVQKSNKAKKGVIICLSDSDDDCVEVISSTPGKNLEKISSNDFENDNDDIIYVEPAPVPVINIDPESEDEEISKTDPELVCSLDTSMSNDFLDEESLETGFDKCTFSSYATNLIQSEFVKPSNPPDVYETSESSTSEKREFVNSVKTIVFNEVAFPRADLFSENNLETFGSFITSKTGNKKLSTKKVTTQKCKGERDENSDSSNDSSSESDYDSLESATNKRLVGTGTANSRNLPELSPMQPPSNQISKVTKTKKGKKNPSKKNDIDALSISTSQEKSGKNKEKGKKVNTYEKDADPIGRATAEVVRAPVTKNKRQSKKLTKEAQHIDDVLETIINANESDNRALCTEKRRKSQDSETQNTEELPKNVSETIENANKPAGRVLSTKKKRQSENLEELLIESSESIENVEGKSLKTRVSGAKKKRQYKDSSDATQNGKELSENTSRNTETAKESSSSCAVEKSKKKRFSESFLSDENIASGSGTSSSNLGDNTLLNKRKKTSSMETEVTSDPTIETKSDVSLKSANNKHGYSTQNKQVGKIVMESSISLNDSGQSEFELVVIDETNSDMEVIHSDSSSDYDFRTFDDIGGELELANTSLCSKVVDGIAKDKDYSEFDVHCVQQNMSDDPNCWKISHQDNMQLYAVRDTGPRCLKCRQRGHLAFRCPNKPDIPSCSLCGKEGHLEPRCPNKVCFQCGNKGAFSTTCCWKCADYRNTICTVCNTLGHNIKVCPDLWRRYHLTTSPGPVVPDDGPHLKPRNEQWCSGCAQQGHLDFECNSYRYNREYPAVSPAVCEYKDVYHMPNTESSIGAPVVQNTSIINPLSLTRYIPNSQIQETFVQKNRSIFQLPPQAIGTDIRTPQEIFGQQVFNPFSIFNKQPTELCRDYNDASKVPQLDSTFFATSSVQQLQLFIHNEVRQLSKMSVDVKDFRTKYNMVRNLSKKPLPTSAFLQTSFLKKIEDLYKQLNMFIFGIHLFRNGKQNLDYLKHALELMPNDKLSQSKRSKLRNAYEYIFGGTAHTDLNYNKVLSNIYYLKNKRK